MHRLCKMKSFNLNLNVLCPNLFHAVFRLKHGPKVQFLVLLCNEALFISLLIYFSAAKRILYYILSMLNPLFLLIWKLIVN